MAPSLCMSNPASARSLAFPPPFRVVALLALYLNFACASCKLKTALPVPAPRSQAHQALGGLKPADKTLFVRMVQRFGPDEGKQPNQTKSNRARASRIAFFFVWASLPGAVPSRPQPSYAVLFFVARAAAMQDC